MKIHVITSVCLACVSTASAWAQSAPSEPAKGIELEEIVVTAQKRSENIQDIPKQVLVVTQADLEQAGVTQLQDLSRIAPSIVGTNQNPPPIRGVSSFVVSQAVQTQTGVVLDDVPQPNFSTLANELSDVEHIEVLAGPQSTLSGRNAAGGLINIVTRSPTNYFTGAGTVEVTSDKQTRITGYASGPVSDKVAFSVSGYKNYWQGQVVDVGEANLPIAPLDNLGARAKVRWELTDNFTATLTGFYSQNHIMTAGAIGGGTYLTFPANAGFAFGLPGNTYGSAFPLITPGPSNTKVQGQRHGYSDTRNSGGTLRLDYDTPIGTLTSLSSYMKSVQPTRLNFLMFPLAMTIAPPGWPGYAYNDTVVSYKVQEFRVTSGDAGPVKYVGGIIYTDTPNSAYYSRVVLGNVGWNRQSEVKSTAAYGRATWDFLPTTSVTLGLRYQSDQNSYGWQSHPTADLTTPINGSYSGSSSYHFWTEEASLQHRFTDTVQGYVTVANAETGQAYDLEDNGSAFSRPVNGLKPVDSERVFNYEIGVKSQWFDRRLTVNFDVFDAKYSNYQIQTLPPPDDPNAVPVIRLFAIGKVETKGAELSSSFRATEQLQLNFNIAYINALLQSYPNAQCYIGQTTGCVGGFQQIHGLTMPGTPKISMNVSTNYRIPFPNLPFDGEVGAFYRYQSSKHFDLYGNPNTNMAGYGVLNLTGALRSHSGNISVEAYANNVFDKRYYSTIGQDSGTGVGGIPPALTVGYARDSFRYYGMRFTARF